MQTFSTSPE